MSRISETQAFSNLNLDAFTPVQASEVETYAANLHVETGQFPITAWCSLHCG